MPCQDDRRRISRAQDNFTLTRGCGGAKVGRMIQVVRDELRHPGESDADRIARWIQNAREEIAQTDVAEIDRIAGIVASCRGHPDLWPWAEGRLHGLGCYWLLMIVEPDRSAVVEARRKSL